MNKDYADKLVKLVNDLYDYMSENSINSKDNQVNIILNGKLSYLLGYVQGLQKSLDSTTK